LLENTNPGAVIADKAYDAAAFIDKLTKQGTTPVIPPKANRKDQRECDFADVWRWFRSRDKQAKSNGHDGKDPGWRGRESIDLVRAQEAIAAVKREAPELDPDVARNVAFAVMRACGLSVPRELFRASTPPAVEAHPA
jgi:hypothetical protein